MNARRVATPELIGDSGVATRRGFERVVDQALKRLAKITCRYAADQALKRLAKITCHYAANQALKRLAKVTCRYAAESALLFYHYRNVQAFQRNVRTFL
jgi:hypothetical protein